MIEWLVAWFWAYQPLLLYAAVLVVILFAITRRNRMNFQRLATLAEQSNQTSREALAELREIKQLLRDRT